MVTVVVMVMMMMVVVMVTVVAWADHYYATAIAVMVVMVMMMVRAADADVDLRELGPLRRLTRQSRVVGLECFERVRNRLQKIAIARRSARYATRPLTGACAGYTGAAYCGQRGCGPQ